MAGLPWLKVATDFADHPKALALASRLGDGRAPLHLPAVWGHFARHYAGGTMPDTEDGIRALERAALWAGAPGALVAALVDVGLLERRRKRLAVHGWEEWQDAHARKLERDRERMREKRAKAHGNGRATVARGSHDGRGREESERRGDDPAAAARARARAGEEPERAAARPRPVFIDATELGPLGAEYRGTVEHDLEHGLAFGGDRAVRDELEGLLAQPWLGVERAAAWTVRTARSRRDRPGAEPGSVEWCVKLLRELRAPAGEPAPDPAWLEALGERRTEAEEQWARVVERVTRSAWPDRRLAALEDELAELIERFTEPRAVPEVRHAAG